MTMTKVTAQSLNLFGPSVNQKTKTKKSTSDFDMVMDKNVKTSKRTEENNAITDQSKTDMKPVKPVKRDETDSLRSNQADSAGKSNSTENTTSKTADNSKQSDMNKINADKTSTDDKTVDMQNQDSNLIEKISGLLESVIESVKSILELSDEELAQMMAEQGLTPADLLNPDVLKQLVLKTNGATDMSAMLTDENMAATMKELLQKVESLKEAFGLNLSKDQMKALLSDIESIPKGQDVKSESTEETKPTDDSINPNKMDLKVVSEKQNLNKEVVENQNTPKESSASLETDSKVVEISAVKSTAALESTPDTSNKDSQNSAKDFQQADQFNLFMDKMTENIKEIQMDANGQVVDVTELRDIANQIVERIKVVLKPDHTSMELQLNPENLGKVNLSVTSKDGVMTAQFTVQNDIAKQAIEGQMQILKETLNQQGVKVESIEVTVSNYESNQNDQTEANSQGQQNQRKRNGIMEEFNSSEDEGNDNIQTIMQELRGNQVEFTA